MLALVLSILFVTVAYAAPPMPGSTKSPWINLKNDKSLARFQSTLLNQTLLTFLEDCYNMPTTKVIDLCSLYFDGILQLNSTDYIVPLSEVENLANEPNLDANFCKQKHNFPDIKYYQVTPKNFSDPVVCGYVCTQDYRIQFVPQPICTFLAWMGDELKNHNSSAVKAVPLTPVVGAISVTRTNSAVVTAANNVTTSQGQAKAAASDSLVPKPETSNIQKSTSTKEVLLPEQSLNKNERTGLILQPKVNSVEPNVNRPPVEVASGVVPSPGEEKKIPTTVVKENHDLVSPTLSINTQEGESPSINHPAAASPEKHDQLPIEPNDEQPNDHDSEADPNEDNVMEDNDDTEFDLNRPKLPKDSQAVPDDNDADQKNSQETIEGNYLQNNVHVTDPFHEESGSNFFTYFLIGMFLCIVLYVGYHNKLKILALLLEGRRSDKGRSGRRKHTAAYRKLDSNLEEAITSSASGRTTQIIY